jgi:hypothetical protein
LLLSMDLSKETNAPFDVFAHPSTWVGHKLLCGWKLNGSRLYDAKIVAWSPEKGHTIRYPRDGDVDWAPIHERMFRFQGRNSGFARPCRAGCNVSRVCACAEEARADYLWNPSELPPGCHTFVCRLEVVPAAESKSGKSLPAAPAAAAGEASESTQGSSGAVAAAAPKADATATRATASTPPASLTLLLTRFRALLAAKLVPLLMDDWSFITQVFHRDCVVSAAIAFTRKTNR